MLFLCAAISGCSLSRGTEEIDRSLVTANVPPAANAANPDQYSDESTIRNAVSSADLGVAGAAPLAWANSDTGSRGAINQVVESRDSGTLCRSFTTTRESFDGIALYKGKTCMVAPGAWQLTAFGPQ